MKLPLFFLTILLCLTQAAFAHSVGFQQFQLSEDMSRPLQVTLWYPTAENEQPQSVAENIAFIGTQVIKDAAIKKVESIPQQHPLILLSHGYRGSWRNLNWLAHQLVQKGFVVAALNHPGTTTFDHSKLAALQWWQRPHDLLRVLDRLLEDSDWHNIIDAENVSAIGHSLGGWSVMQLAGAQVDRSEFNKQCQRYPNPRTCGLKSELGLNFVQPDEPKSLNFYDSRIKKVISLDLGLARSFAIESMQKVNTPVLILAAGIDIGDLPQAKESGYLAEHLPLLNRHYKVYEQAMHFSFMQLCKPNAIAILEEESQGDGIVCKDGIDTNGINTNRQALHKQMFKDMLSFLLQ